MAKESKINKAAASQPKSGHNKPAGKASGSMVGNETKAAIKKAGLDPTTSVVGTTSLSTGCEELRRQHSEAPFRHMPLHGMKSGGAM